jgi:hypothetical protein
MIKHRFFIRLFFSSILFTVYHNVSAQTHIHIYGNISNQNNLGIEKVDIRFLDLKDSSIVGNTMSDSLGNFSVYLKYISKVIIRAKHIEYETSIKINKLKGTSEGVYFILQKKNKLLNEVKITASKPLFEYKAGKTIFNVENSISLEGSDVLNALRKIPGVLVKNNQISLAGKGAVSIMINGRLQQMSAEDIGQLLQSMSSDNVSKIELMTAPSARYDAEGGGGMINIITKKSQKEGLKGNLTLRYNRNHFNSLASSGNMFYKKNKLNLFCNLNARSITWKYTSYSTTYFTENNWKQEIGNAMHSKNALVQTGMDYSFNSNNILGFSITNAMTLIDNDEQTIAEYKNASNQLKESINTTGNTNDQYLGKRSFNLNFEHKFDTLGTKLNMDYDVFSNAGNRSRYFTIDDYSLDSNRHSIAINRLLSDPQLLIQTAKFDLEYPRKFGNITFGSKLSFVQNIANNQFQFYDVNTYKDDLKKSNAFDYKEQTQAGYIMMNKTIKKYELSMGLRLEHTSVNGYSSTLSQTNTQDYLNLFPQATIQYNMNINNSLTLMLLRRIKRPDYNQLNPFRFYYSPNAYTEGNPILQPSISNILQIDYIHKSQWTFSFAYVHTENYFDRIFIIDSVSNTSNITRQNIGTTNYLEWSVLYNLKPTKWWELSGNFNLAYNGFSPYQKGPIDLYASFNAWFNTNNNFYFNKARTIVGEFNLNYYTPRQKDYKVWDYMLSVNCGIKFLLMNKNLSIAIYGNDLSAGTYWLQTNELNKTIEYTYDDERSLHISMSYKFGNKILKNNRPKNTVEEMQRAN